MSHLYSASGHMPRFHLYDNTAFKEGPETTLDHADLISRADTLKDRARLAVCSEGSEDWLLAAPIMVVGVRLLKYVGTQLGAGTYKPHLCPCGKMAESRVLRGLSRRKSASMQQKRF